MKIVLVLIIGLLLWNHNGARKFTADALNNLAEIIEPEQHPKTIGDHIDGLLGQ